MRFPRLARKRLVLLTGFVVVALATAGGLAYAAIPDGSGVIHGCYAKNNGQLRVVDTDAGGKCIAGEKSLNWSQIGPRGETGPQGPSDAYYAKGTVGELIPSYPRGVTLLTLDVPAGEYAVTAKAALADNRIERVDARCQIVSGDTELDEGSLFLAGGLVTSEISLLATASGPTTLKVHCFRFDAEGLEGYATMLVTKVGAIHQ